MASIYKILYEVKLLHEYYLTDKNGSSIFDKPTQQGKINFLAEFFKLNRSTIASDLDFLLPEFSKEIFSNYQLRLIPSYSGFRVAIKVEPKKLSDNSTGFKPLVPFPDDLPLAIGLYKKNPSIDLLSNNRFNSEHTGIYFFTNRELGNPKSFPVLSEAIPSYSPGSRYEQGELTLDYSNNTQAFYLDENENEQWLPVSGSGFVNENDRMLVNKRFFYNFNQSDQVNQAEFKLKDKTGNEIKNLLIKNPAGIQKAQIDFSSENLFHSGYSLDGPYTLEITADNGF